MNALKRTLENPFGAIIDALDASERQKQRFYRAAGVETKKSSETGLTRKEVKSLEQSL